MKAILTITAIVLSSITLTAVASELPSGETAKAGRISLPEMNWGSADEVNDKEIERIKYNKALVQMPAINWGNPDEVTAPASSIELPAMNWGSPEEVDIKL